MILGMCFVLMAVMFLGHTSGAANDKVYVHLEGGSGRAKYEKTATYREKDGKGTAEFVFQSPYYTWMKVNGEKVPDQHTEETSIFEVPVEKLGAPVEVVTENTRMSQPHEIAYTLVFSEEEIQTEKTDSLSKEAEKKIAKRQAEVQKLKDEKAKQDAAGEKKKVTIIILAIILLCFAVVEAKSIGRKHHDKHHRHS